MRLTHDDRMRRLRASLQPAPKTPSAREGVLLPAIRPNTLRRFRRAEGGMRAFAAFAATVNTLPRSAR